MTAEHAEEAVKKWDKENQTKYLVFMINDKAEAVRAANRLRSLGYHVTVKPRWMFFEYISEITVSKKDMQITFTYQNRVITASVESFVDDEEVEYKVSFDNKTLTIVMDYGGEWSEKGTGRTELSKIIGDQIERHTL